MIATGFCVLLIGVVAFPQETVPEITLEPGELFFRLDGTPSFLPGTNPTGFMSAHFDTLLGFAGGSDRIVRIHITNGRRPDRETTPGEVDEAWAVFWDSVFETAAQNGLNVLPVFDVWADWNMDNTGSQSWANNPYNTVNGGPAADPVELLGDTEARELWLEWLETLIVRWQDRPNILGWEVFSELNLISGATETAAVDFVASAAAVVRGVDMSNRPITASLAGVNDWPTLSSSSAMDFIQIHPYAENVPFEGNLDQLILTTVRGRLAQYDKPVFIGESGLDSRAPVDPLRTPVETLTLSTRAPVGINQAIWASAVSGAMNGRMLWFEDGYDLYHQNVDGSPLDLRTGYKDASQPVARFVEGVDYSGFEPVDLTVSNDITGAALGNDDIVLGWVRDIQSTAPEWPSRFVNDQTVTVTTTAPSDQLQVTFYDTGSGEPVQSVDANQQDGQVLVALPSFEGSIAFQIQAGSSTLNFPALIRGGGSSSQVVIGAGDTALSVDLSFYAPDGALIESQSTTVSPNGVSSIDFQGNDLELGSLTLTVEPSDAHVLATEIISLLGVPPLGVPPSPLCSSPEFLMVESGDSRTAGAFSNPSGADMATCSWEVFSEEGVSAGLGSFEVSPQGQVQFFPGDQATLPEDFLGSFKASCDVPVHVFSLFQRSDGSLTSNAAGCGEQ